MTTTFFLLLFDEVVADNDEEEAQVRGALEVVNDEQCVVGEVNAVTLLFDDDMQINEMRSASNAEVHTLSLGLPCIIPLLFCYFALISRCS